MTEMITAITAQCEKLSVKEMDMITVAFSKEFERRIKINPRNQNI